MSAENNPVSQNKKSEGIISDYGPLFKEIIASTVLIVFIYGIAYALDKLPPTPSETFEELKSIFWK